MPSGVYVRTEEHNRKLAKSRIGRKWSWESRVKLSNSRTGKGLGPRSDEFKEKRRKYMLSLGKENPFLNPLVIEKNIKRMKDPSNPSEIMRRKKISFHMKNGGSVYANSFIKNPSKPQMELYKLVKSIYFDAEIDFWWGWKYRIDVAIPSQKIALEYDGSYWHKNKKEYDLLRQGEIESTGWKVIRYVDWLPKKEDLIKDLEAICQI